ncbi:MAG: hypothetical protein KJO29_08455, partial [Bacteroidia bacterium]|nr:hypothetical protein [Bacteroidia bacterium]
MINTCSGQDRQEEKIDLLNNYIEFLNASVHGLSIAQVIFVNYNKVINKYVDINSHELTQISNKDLPQNIFGGTDSYLNFYDQSDTPEALAEIAKEGGLQLQIRLSSTLNFYTDNIISILKEINQIRFDVEDYIKDHDLNDREAIYGVYEYLERATVLFNEYSSAHLSMVELLFNNGIPKDNTVVETMLNLHTTNKMILSYLRRNEGKGVDDKLRQLKTQVDEFRRLVDNNTYDAQNTEYLNDILIKNNAIIKKLDDYVTTAYVPLEDEAYGKYYHYHNFILRYINWYGPGYIRSMNDFIDGQDLQCVHFDEEPIIYKVLYPMKKFDNSEIKENKEIGVALSPRQINSPQLSLSPVEEKPEEDYIEFEFFDYQMMDRDSVSVSLNGEVILKDFALGFDSKKVT